MNIKIDKEKKSAQFIGVPIFVSVLLLTMMLAVPASPLFAGTIIKEGTTITQGKTIDIDPPRVAAHVDLKPEDGPVIFFNNWYTTEFNLADLRKGIERMWRGIGSGAILELIAAAKEFKSLSNESGVNFWLGNKGGMTKLNPPQGGTESYEWKNCYTKQELEAYKREALRWANYILDVYVPAKFPDLKK